MRECLRSSLPKYIDDGRVGGSYSVSKVIADLPEITIRISPSLFKNGNAS